MSRIERLRTGFVLETHEERPGGTKLGDREFIGHASVFGNEFDAFVPSLFAIVPTVVEEGAFVKSLEVLEEAGKHVPVFWEHREPIGLSLALGENDRGLRVHGRVSNTTEGRDRLELMRDGVAEEMSIGFVPIRWETRKNEAGDEVRHILEGALREVTVCVFGANPEASVDEVASSTVRLSELLMKENHAGRVLSAANRRLVSAAADALSALLKAADKAKSAEDEDEETESDAGQVVSNGSRYWADSLELSRESLAIYRGQFGA